MMNTKKRVICLLPALLAALCLCACDRTMKPTEWAPEDRPYTDSGTAAEGAEDSGWILSDGTASGPATTPGDLTAGADYVQSDGTASGSGAAPAPAESWAPDFVFSTTDADGQAWTDACFAGAKLTMLNSWAYWCGPCVGELPELQRLSEDYAAKGLQLLGVTDEADFELSVDKMKELGVTYPCLVADEALAEATYTGYVPTTLFVDQNGKVLDGAYVGSRSYADWAAIIEGYLG